MDTVEYLKQYEAVITRTPLTKAQYLAVKKNLIGSYLDVFTFDVAQKGVLIYLKEGKAKDWGYNPSKNYTKYLELDAVDFVNYATTGNLPSAICNNSKSLLGKVPPLIQFDATLGAKYDTGKLLFRALTRGLALPLRAVAAVLTYGAIKYKEDSWQHVPDAKARYESALDRHLNAWKAGEECDEESGLPHLAHAACNALFLLWFDITDGTIKGDYTKFNQPPKV